MKLLVSTWGLPRDWKDATYEFEGTFLKSCTTLGLLSRKYDKVVVLVLDSIVDAVARVDLNTSCGECFKKHWRDFTGNDYPSLIQHVKETIHGILSALSFFNIAFTGIFAGISTDDTISLYTSLILKLAMDVNGSELNALNTMLFSLFWYKYESCETICTILNESAGMKLMPCVKSMATSSNWAHSFTYLYSLIKPIDI